MCSQGLCSTDFLDKCGVLSVLFAALNFADIEAELDRLEFVHNVPVISENPSMPKGGREGAPPAPRPLSPTRLQPVVAPEAQGQEIPHLEELLRMRAEIPRALKRRGSVDQSQPQKRASHYQPNQYKNLIDKLFRRKKGDNGSETSSSSEEEEAALPPAPLPAPTMHPDFKVRKRRGPFTPHCQSLTLCMQVSCLSR